jgi:cell division protein FtsZ
MPAVQPAAIAGHPLQQASRPVAPSAPQANPVGEVHERIRRLLTEGSVDDASPAAIPSPSPTPTRIEAATDAARAHRNPFREAAEELGKTSMAALDLLKSMGGAPVRREETPVRREDHVRARSAASGDLFEEDEDSELEIPSFLRKKKAP